MNARRQLVSFNEATVTDKQHTKPCSDCPWARTALNGWLGENSIEDWISAAHGDGVIECHTIIPAQCAGSSIYRANVGKLSRDEAVLRLPARRDLVFSSPVEFREHHSKLPRET